KVLRARVQFRDHGSQLLTRLAQLRIDSQLCDVTLVAEGTRIKANRTLLAACSDYFKAMFTSDMAESRLQEIEMVDIEASTLDALINYCYSGKIKLTDANVVNILGGACLLQLPKVKEECCNFLKKGLNSSNCLKIRKIADTYACPELLQFTEKYILHNFRGELNLLSVDQLTELISSDKLNVRSEKQVYTVVLMWVKYDLPARKQFLS
ncbi:BTB/POZ domain protein, partial [Cooperia oncophora]